MEQILPKEVLALGLQEANWLPPPGHCPLPPGPPPPNWLPWPRHPLTNEASPALPSANQSGWSLASGWLHQWEGLIDGLEQELLTGTGGWVPLTMPSSTPSAATTGIHKMLPKKGDTVCFFCPFALACEEIVLGNNQLKKKWDLN